MHARLLLFSFVLAGFVGAGQPHINAHAHNDYEHDRPLFEAIENGFVSIEVDVHLINGRILVAHDHPTSSSKMLEDLYLRPLDSISRKNGGKIYPQKDIVVMLMIDVKTDGEETFRVLHQLLSKYRDILSRGGHKSLRVFISGNRAIEQIRNDAQSLFSIDGRPEDLGKGFTEQEMPVISENYRKIISWNGKGSPSKEDLNKLTLLASKVHAENKKLRLWGIPDHENGWSVLLEAGVDLVSTDKLKELNVFLTTKKL
jgi:glycerophosphoryl diester phosphodiesterase